MRFNQTYYHKYDRKKKQTDVISRYRNCIDLKNSRTLFLFYKYGSYRKNVINKIILFFDFIVVSRNLVQISPLVTMIQNLWNKYICYILLYDAYVIKIYGKYKKKRFFQENCFIFLFYVCIPYSVQF